MGGTNQIGSGSRQNAPLKADKGRKHEMEFCCFKAGRDGDCSEVLRKLLELKCILRLRYIDITIAFPKVGITRHYMNG